MTPGVPSRRSRPSAPWSGALFLSDARGFYLGPTPRTERHAHHAVQLCVGVDGPLRFRAGGAKTWSVAPAVLIPSDQPHEIDGGGRLVALVLLDPEGVEARAGLWGAHPVVLEVERARRERLLRFWRQGCPAHAAGGVCDMVRNYRADFYGRPMTKVVQEAMRGPSPWSVGDRELMAAFVSKTNECEF